jgi:hypothetical protein
MIGRLIGQRKASTRTTQVRQRAREEGVGLPDLTAPSAHHEVELSPELIAAVKEFYAQIQEEREERPASGAAEGVDDERSAQALADSEDRRLIAIKA